MWNKWERMVKKKNGNGISKSLMENSSTNENGEWSWTDFMGVMGGRNGGGRRCADVNFPGFFFFLFFLFILLTLDYSLGRDHEHVWLRLGTRKEGKSWMATKILFFWGLYRDQIDKKKIFICNCVLHIIAEIKVKCGIRIS